MSEVGDLVATVKRQLKSQGLTYRDVAKALRLSEASVKRVFARESFTVERLAQVAHLLGFTLAELLAESAARVPLPSFLPAEVERRLVADETLLLVAVLALNRWSVDEMTTAYRLGRAEAVRRLLALDRLGVIELLPGDRIRPLVARDFDWLEDGPIRRYFMDKPLADFLASRFNGAEDVFDFAQGMLTESALAQLRQDLRRVRKRVAALHEASAGAPLSQRHGVGLVVALRRWQPESFRRLLRG